MNAETKLVCLAIASVSLLMAATFAFVASRPHEKEGLAGFSSELELRHFLSDGAPDRSGTYRYSDERYAGSDQLQEIGGSYSTTNVQVAGVDEADTVKTDGESIFVGNSYNVTIVKAMPPGSMQIQSVIEVSSLSTGEEDKYLQLQGFFLVDDKLVLLVSESPVYLRLAEDVQWISDQYAIQYEPPRTLIAIFDVSDTLNPSLTRSLAVSGYYLTSRMIDDTAYLMTQAYIWAYDDDIVLPSVWRDEVQTQVRITDIRYDPETPDPASFVNVLAIDVDTGNHEIMSVIADWASVIFVSQDSIYFTVEKYNGDLVWVDGLESPEDYSSALTTIYRIDVDGLFMSVGGSGDVRGWLLNQFSMDECDQHLRVATTTNWWNPENAVYVLDGSMKVVGKLENLAPTERIYSSRFVGDTLYLVTFRQIDPLFVIDLSDPAFPSVIGELKIPGFSSYLHPVDATHLLGIGTENSSLKITLFDVSDPANPVEQSTYLTDVGWYSNALYDHKAVLFDYDLGLLAIPAYSWSYDFYSDDSGYRSGTLVFNVSVSSGVSLRGFVEQESSYSGYWSNTVQRCIYIGEYLYSISPNSIQVNRLADLSYVGIVMFAGYEEYAPDNSWT